jgi:hypothetical protein
MKRSRERRARRWLVEELTRQMGRTEHAAARLPDIQQARIFDTAALPLSSDASR